MLDTVFLYLIRLGFGVYFVGRLLIIYDNRRANPQEFGMNWCIGMLLSPLMELMSLLRFYKPSVRGAALSLIGMCMAVPWLGAELTKKQEADLKRTAARELRSEAAQETSLPDSVVALKSEGIAIREQREQRLQLLQVRLAGWYQQIQQRRGTLVADDPGAVSAFNAEAAAYKGLNDLAKEEQSELAAPGKL